MFVSKLELFPFLPETGSRVGETSSGGIGWQRIGPDPIVYIIAYYVIFIIKTDLFIHSLLIAFEIIIFYFKKITKTLT